MKMKWINSGLIRDKKGNCRILWLCPKCKLDVSGIGLNVPDEKSVCPYCGFCINKDS